MIIYVPNAGTAKGAVNFDSPVGPGGGSVTLVSDTPAIATVVSPLAVLEGDICREFVIAFVSAGNCIVTATFNGVAKTVNVVCAAPTAIPYPFDAALVVDAAISADLSLLGLTSLEANLTVSPTLVANASARTSLEATLSVDPTLVATALARTSLEATLSVDPTLVATALARTSLEANLVVSSVLTAPLGAHARLQANLVSIVALVGNLQLRSIPIPAGVCERTGLDVIEATIIVINHVAKVRVHLRSLIAIPAPATYIPSNNLECVIISEAGLGDDTIFSSYTLVEATTIDEYYHYVIDAEVARNPHHDYGW